MAVIAPGLAATGGASNPQGNYQVVRHEFQNQMPVSAATQVGAWLPCNLAPFIITWLALLILAFAVAPFLADYKLGAYVFWAGLAIGAPVSAVAGPIVLARLSFLCFGTRAVALAVTAAGTFIALPIVGILMASFVKGWKDEDGFMAAPAALLIPALYLPFAGPTTVLAGGAAATLAALFLLRLAVIRRSRPHTTSAVAVLLVGLITVVAGILSGKG